MKLYLWNRLGQDARRVGKCAFWFFCAGAVLLVTFIGFNCSGANLDLATTSSGYSPPASGNGDSVLPVISADGRFVFFGSTANNLALGPGGGPYGIIRPVTRNVFLRDRMLGATALISVDSTGTTGANDECMPTAISSNSQFLLFESSATNLAAETGGGVANVFVRDTLANLTILVSVATNFGGANGKCTDSTMTPDGNYVAFSSLASNLVSGDTNGIADVFVHDLRDDTTVLASVGAQPATVSSTYGSVLSSDLPEITPDGRFVAFLSTATNLVPGITNPGEIYVRDLVNNLTYCVSTNAHTYFGNSISFSHRISANGQFVVFESYSPTSANSGIILRHNLQTGADDLVSSNAAQPADFYKYIQSLDITPDGRFVAFVAATNSGSCVLLWDGQANTTTLVSVGTNGTAPPTGATCDTPLIDKTGQFISFRSTAANLVTNIVAAGSQHLYRRDLQAQVTILLDVATNGNGSTGIFQSPQNMDASGRFVAFDSNGSDLVTNDNNGSSDVFVCDAANGTIELVSVDYSSFASRTIAPGSVSSRYNISADGRFMVFAASGSGFVPGYTNQYRGVYLRDLIFRTNMLVSVSTNGIGDANGWSTEPVISGNGRYVAITSYASNLVPNDTNRASDVFVRDLQTGQTSLVSLNPAGNGSIYPGAYSPLISFDGRYIAFQAYNKYNYYLTLLLRDTVLATNYILGQQFTDTLSMTPDGHYIGFYGYTNTSSAGLGIHIWDSQAAKLVYNNNNNTRGSIALSTNGQWLAYVNFQTSVLHLADRIANADQAIGNRGIFGPQTKLKFSDDGRFLVYSTAATNTPNANNSFQKVYVYDQQTGSNLLVSQQYFSTNAAAGNSASAGISADGHFVVYESIASDIVPAGGNRARNVFLYDRTTGATTALSAGINGSGLGDSFSENPVFTGDGQTVVFYSFASNLTTNDFNSGGDLFVVKLYSTNSIAGSTNLPPLTVNQITYVPGSAQGNASPALTWTALPGVSYQVWFKDNLSDAVWQPLNGNMTIVGSQGQAVDLAPNPSHRFYRIQAN